MNTSILDHANYVEIWFGVANKTDGVFETGLHRDTFGTMLKNMRNFDHSDVKHFQGDFKVYQHYDMHMVKKIEEDQATDIKVYQQKVTDVQHDKFTSTIAFERKKISSVLFPSTMDLHRVTFVRKLVFRINHRLYVNFVIEKEQGETDKHYKVFINFNSSKDVDLPQQCALMNQLVQHVTSTLVVPTS